MKNKTWSRTKVQGLLRHRGGEYYARLYVSGKEKWVHLKTQHLEVAKARIEEEKKAIAAARKVGWAVKKGVVPVNEAVKAYEYHLRLRVGLKESTRQYYGWVLKAILKSWPELLEMEIPAVTENDCKEWAQGFSKEYSPLYYNTAVLILNELFKMAIKTGAIYRNPAEGIELRKKPQRKLELPTCEQFRQVVDFVAAGKHRTAKLAANLIEFLAYTGCRISEAQRVTWSDCDFERGTLTIKGDAETATKNWKIRHIPLIPDAKTLLERLRKDRLGLNPEDPIMLVGDVRGAFERAADELGVKLTHHSLRHLFATTCIEAGVDIPTVSRWLGHSDGGVLALKTYGHLRDEHSKRSALLVSFAAFPQPTEAAKKCLCWSCRLARLRITSKKLRHYRSNRMPGLRKNGARPEEKALPEGKCNSQGARVATNQGRHHSAATNGSCPPPRYEPRPPSFWAGDRNAAR